MSTLLNRAQVKRYVTDKRPGVRVSKEFLDRAEAGLRVKLDWALQLPSNRRTVRDFIVTFLNSEGMQANMRKALSEIETGAML